MTEPTILCPNCKTEIKLTEPLAAPLIESTRKQFEQRIAQREAEVDKREAAVHEQQTVLAKVQKSIEKQFAAKLKPEREGLAIKVYSRNRGIGNGHAPPKEHRPLKRIAMFRHAYFLKRHATWER